MSGVAWLLAVPFSALVTGGGLRAAGAPRRMAVGAGLVAGVVTGIALVAVLLVALRECMADTTVPPQPPAWPWSPRRQLCTDAGSPAALGLVGVLLAPAALVALGTFLRFKRHPALGWTAYALLLITPALPSLYVDALPYYRVDSSAILHDPLLRPASGSRPPRVCYVYGIAFGPRRVQVTGATRRECVDLEPTPQALRLAPADDGGRTSYDLDWMGKKLTQKGLPVRPGATGIDGLVVDRAYALSDREARIGATGVG